MKIVKPHLSAGNYFTVDIVSGKSVCLFCHNGYGFRSLVEKANHIVGGQPGYKQCTGNITSVIYKQVSHELASYCDWKEAKKHSRENLQEVVRCEPLPTVLGKRKIQSTLYGKGEAKAALHQKAARMVYMSPGCSAKFMEHPATMDFFSSLKPGYKAPSASSIYGVMLDDEKKLTDRKFIASLNLEDPDTRTWVNCDVWEGPNGDNVFAMCISTPNSGPFVVHSELISKGKCKNNVFLAAAMERGIESLRTIKPDIQCEPVLGLSTDNESAMTTAWDGIRSSYPGMITMPCDGHGSNLMYDDLMKLDWAASLCASSSFLASFARNNKAVEGFLQDWAKTNHGYAYRTTLSGGRQCHNYYNASRNLMFTSGWQALLLSPVWANLRDSESKEKAATILADKKFFPSLAALHAFVKPVKVMCKLHDNSAYTTSKAYDAMMTVELHILGPVENRSTAKSHGVPPAFFTAAKRILKERWEWMQSDPHYSSYAVDPEFWAHNIFGLPKVMAALRRMAKLWLDTEAEFHECMASFGEYKNKTGLFSDPTTQQAAKTMTPITFWQQYGGSHPSLQRVAINSLSCNGSSMDVERLFSIWKQTWNKKTSQMSFDTASKLVAVQFNLTAIQKAKACLNRRTVAQGWMKAHLEGYVEDTM